MMLSWQTLDPQRHSEAGRRQTTRQKPSLDSDVRFQRLELSVVSVVAPEGGREGVLEPDFAWAARRERSGCHERAAADAVCEREDRRGVLICCASVWLERKSGEFGLSSSFSLRGPH